MNVGDIVELKPRFEDLGLFAIILEISKSEYDGNGGWISFEYVVMTNLGVIYRISGDVIKRVYTTII